MEHQKIIDHIVKWLKTYVEKAGVEGFVVGVSGGVDSAFTSVLCALTEKKVMLVNIPILQQNNQLKRANDHIEWLKNRFANVTDLEVDLTDVFNSVKKTYPLDIQDELTMANVRSRLRMTTLYAIAGHHGLLVTGTGNKVEDFGVGFFTKYGDGGVDISPIADLMKTEVFELASYLNIIDSILKAKPTDGLWGDDRSDEDQLGATYPELEWAMKYTEDNLSTELSEREKTILVIYKRLHQSNKHKMTPIPLCSIPQDWK
jgi:NAD+ synthase